MSRLLRAQPFIEALSGAWLTLRSRVTDRYHPERHYMRGPGPKARAKREG